MPLDLQVVLSSSPPVFSDFAFNNRQLSKRAAYADYDAIRYINGLNRRTDPDAVVPHVRPCLIVKHDPEEVIPSRQQQDDAMVIGSDPNGTNRKSKHVWFADDRGLALTHVRLVAEPSDCPPQWTDEFLERVTGGVYSSPASSSQCWEPTFPQPASDYLEFRNKVERQLVSLENVIVRQEEAMVTGTIKVKNTAFEKDVFVRVTFDRWLTHEDVRATYADRGNGLDGVPPVFDTFTFAFAIPPTAVKFQMIEFCVCYKANETEHWDNNGGYNYKLVPFSKKKDSSTLPAMNRFVDAFTANIDSWSEFASWQHLICDGPYW